MQTLKLNARYVREIADRGLPNREENFRYGHVDWDMPVEQAALVLVDCWAVHPVASVSEVTEKIAREHILPAVTACRETGVAVIHAPSADDPEVKCISCYEPKKTSECTMISKARILNTIHHETTTAQTFGWCLFVGYLFYVCGIYAHTL